MKKDFKELTEKIIEVVNNSDTDYDSREQIEELLEQHYPVIPTVSEEKGEKVWILYGANAFDRELEGIYDDPAPIVERFNESRWHEDPPYKNVQEVMDDYENQNEMEQWVEVDNIIKVKVSNE